MSWFLDTFPPSIYLCTVKTATEKKIQFLFVSCVSQYLEMSTVGFALDCQPLSTHRVPFILINRFQYIFLQQWIHSVNASSSCLTRLNGHSVDDGRLEQIFGPCCALVE